MNNDRYFKKNPLEKNNAPFTENDVHDDSEESLNLDEDHNLKQKVNKYTSDTKASKGLDELFYDGEFFYDKKIDIMPFFERKFHIASLIEEGSKTSLDKILNNQKTLIPQDLIETEAKVFQIIIEKLQQLRAREDKNSGIYPYTADRWNLNDAIIATQEAAKNNNNLEYLKPQLRKHLASIKDQTTKNSLKKLRLKAALILYKFYFEENVISPGYFKKF